MNQTVYLIMAICVVIGISLLFQGPINEADEIEGTDMKQTIVFDEVALKESMD